MYGYDNKLYKSTSTEKYSKMVIFVYEPMQLEFDLLSAEFGIPDDLFDKLDSKNIGVWSNNGFVLAKLKIVYNQDSVSCTQDVSAIFNTDIIIIISDRKIKTLYKIVNHQVTFNKYIYIILNGFIDSYIKFIDELGIQVVNNENNIHELINIYKKLLELKKYVLLETEIFEFLIDSPEVYDVDIQPFLKNSINKFVNVNSIIDIEIERINVLKDKHNVDQNSNLDRLMKKLTSYTVLFSLPTLIVGLFGMNFNYGMGSNLEYGFYLVIALITFIFSVMGYLFKKNKWF